MNQNFIVVVKGASLMDTCTGKIMSEADMKKVLEDPMQNTTFKSLDGEFEEMEGNKIKLDGKVIDNPVKLDDLCPCGSGKVFMVCCCDHTNATAEQIWGEENNFRVPRSGCKRCYGRGWQGTYVGTKCKMRCTCTEQTSKGDKKEITGKANKKVTKAQRKAIKELEE